MKNEIDLTNGSIVNKIYLFALPLAATSVLQQLFNAADVAIVGHFCGTEAMAAVGTNSSLISLIVNLFVGISLGSTVVIARCIGSKNTEGIRKAVHTSIILAVIGGIIMSFIGECMATIIMKSLNVPKEVFQLALLYLRIYLVGLPVMFLYNFEAAIFRASGDTRTPLIALTIAGVTNVLLNLFFVRSLNMTVDGVAIATVISNLISSMILFGVLLRTNRNINIRICELRMNKDILLQILRIGLPSGIQSCMFSFANVIIQTAINSLGAIVMAASSAAFNVEILSYFILNAFGQTCTTFVGQNYGAGKMERCREVLKQVFIHGYICTTCACILIYFTSGFLLKLFTDNVEVIQYGQIRLIIVYIAYIFSVWQELGSGYLRAFGLSAFPAAISVVGICGIRILWISTVFKMSPSFKTIMMIYPISLFITGAAILVSIWILKPSRKRQAKY